MMGAAGYVTIYDEAKVRTEYANLFPEHNLDKDWNYLSTITADLDGKKWILNYWDDQGHQIGAENEFWFADDAAMHRVNVALQKTKPQATIEVWT